MKNYSLLIALFLGLLFTACKKCDPANETTGKIIANSSVRVLWGSAESEGVLYSLNNPAPFEVEISTNNGYSYIPIDYTKYSIAGIKTDATCSSGYHRHVAIDDQNKIFTYTVTITEYTTCKNNVSINNWVLVKAVPSDYTTVFSTETVRE